MRVFNFWLAASLSIVCFQAAAGTASFVAQVSKVLVDDTYYGGCMAQLTQSPTASLPACSANWLTFDCDATFPESTKSNALNKFSQAQLALITGREVFVSFTDARIANGYCLANRIDLR